MLLNLLEIIFIYILFCLDQPSDLEDSWSEWSSWNTCSADCGGGVQVKTRTCDGPMENCDGPTKLTRPCNTHRCKGIVYSKIFYQ